MYEILETLEMRCLLFVSQIYFIFQESPSDFKCLCLGHKILAILSLKFHELFFH